MSTITSVVAFDWLIRWCGIRRRRHCTDPADEASPTQQAEGGDLLILGTGREQPDDQPCAGIALPARYTAGMASTTVKMSTETRDRIRALGGDTLEDTIVEALDALEANRFWAQAEAAAAWRRSLSDAERARLQQPEAELDAALDGIE